jgi:hypothetical protein
VLKENAHQIGLDATIVITGSNKASKSTRGMPNFRFATAGEKWRILCPNVAVGLALVQTSCVEAVCTQETAERYARLLR